MGEEVGGGLYRTEVAGSVVLTRGYTAAEMTGESGSGIIAASSWVWARAGMTTSPGRGSHAGDSLLENRSTGMSGISPSS